MPTFRIPATVLRAAVALACATFVAALAMAGRGIEGWSHLDHPLALAGAAGMPGATLFNACAFVLPGLVAMVASDAWRAGIADDAPLPLRLAPRLLLVSALAFAAQGVWPLDPRELDAGDSRFHATAWITWLIAATCGAFAQGLGLRGRARAWPLAIAAVLLACQLLPQAWLAAGIAQRLAFAAWFAWWVPVAWRSPRGQPPL